VLWLLVTADIPNSLIPVTLMMQAICSSGTSVVTTATGHRITEDDILHSHRRGNLKSYKTSLLLEIKNLQHLKCSLNTNAVSSVRTL
jgi:hypothetical protein